MKHFRKKSTAVGIALLILVSMLPLTLPARVSAEEGDKQLTVWVESSFSDEANQAVKDRIVSYATENDIQITQEYIAAVDFMTKLNPAIEADMVPDVTTGAPHKVLSYYPNNPYRDVSDLTKEIHENSPYFESMIEGTKIEGKNYFVPFVSSSEVLFIRKDLMEDAGVSELPETWNEVYDLAAELSRPDEGIYGFGMGCGPTDEDAENMFRMMLWGMGGRLFDEEGNIVANEDENVIALIDKYKDMYDQGIIPPSAPSWDPGGNNKSYLVGESAIVLNAPTLYNAIANDENYADLYENTIVIAPPKGTEASTLLGIPQGWSIMAGSAHQDTAEEMIKYMFDQTWYENYMSLVSPVFAPVFEEYKDHDLWKDDGVNHETILYVERADGYYGYPTETIEGRALSAKDYFNFPCARMLNNVVAGGMTAEEAVEQYVIDVERIGEALD